MNALTTSTVEVATRQIEMLAEYFNQALEPHVLRLYIDALRDTPVEDLRAGCRRCITTQRFMPKVADIRAAVVAERADRHRVEQQGVAPGPRHVSCTNCDDTGLVIVAERTDRAAPTVGYCPSCDRRPHLRTPKHVGEGER